MEISCVLVSTAGSLWLMGESAMKGVRGNRGRGVLLVDGELLSTKCLLSAFEVASLEDLENKRVAGKLGWRHDRRRESRGVLAADTFPIKMRNMLYCCSRRQES